VTGAILPHTASPTAAVLWAIPIGIRADPGVEIQVE